MAYDPESDPETRDPQRAGTDEPGQKTSNGAELAETRSESKAKDVERQESRATAPKKSTEASSQLAYDDDLDDEDDDDDEDEEEREARLAAARRAKAKRQAARSRAARRRQNLPKTEEELNIPKRQTIGMLGSVSLLMLIMWFAAKLACNAHPDHIRDPRYVSVDQLARDPKNAALEFQLRFSAKDYLLAGEIASGKMAERIRELLAFCEANVDACEKDRLALKDKVTATAALLEASPSRAVVDVTTYVNNANPKAVTLELVPMGQVWKVTQSRDGSAQTAGAANPAPVMVTP